MFKVGDLVWSEESGKGKVVNVHSGVLFPIRVLFFEHGPEVYTLEGHYWDTEESYRPGDKDRDIVPYTGQDKEPQIPTIDKSVVEANKRPAEHVARVERPSTIADYLEQARKWDTEIPDNVKRYLLGNMRATIGYAHDQVSIGEADYATIDELREAVEWFVGQLGGDVKWEEK